MPDMPVVRVFTDRDGNEWVNRDLCAHCAYYGSNLNRPKYGECHGQAVANGPKAYRLTTTPTSGCALFRLRSTGNAISEPNEIPGNPEWVAIKEERCCTDLNCPKCDGSNRLYVACEPHLFIEKA